MKFRLTYLAGVLAFLCSCTDDSLVNNDQGLRIIGSLETEARTAFVQDDDKTHTRWVEGDQIGIFTDQQSNLPHQALGEGSVTEFVKVAESLECTEGAKVWAYYPYASEKQHTVVDLPHTAKLSSTDSVPVFLYGEATATATDVTLQFKHYFAYLKLTLSAELVRTIKEAHASFGKLTYEDFGIYINSTEPIATSSPARLDLKTMEITHGENSLRIDYRCTDIDVEGNGTYTYLIPVLPQSPSAEIQIWLCYQMVDQSLYPVLLEKKTLPQNGLQAGAVYASDYTHYKPVTNFMDGSQTTLKELFARNKLTQVITLEPDAGKMVNRFGSAQVNRHLDYRGKGLQTVIFTGAQQEGESEELKNSIREYYNGVEGISWLYGNHNGTASYFYDSEGNLVYVAPFSIYTDPALVQSNLDAFLRATLGEPEEHEAFKMNFYTSTDYSMNGEVYLLQQATQGNGVDIILMGDGFTDKHMNPGGRYEEKMREACETIFSIEPYKTLRNRFNVYVVKVVSPHAEFATDAVHAIHQDNSVALNYAALTGTSCPLVAVIYNTEFYVDRSYCQPYWDNSCVCYCMEKIGGTLKHELCGHGIAWLADEYVEPGRENLALPEEELLNLQTYYWPNLWEGNVDIQADPSEVRWAHMLKDERYKAENLGIYEGAYYYGLGIYRPTETSIMRNDYLDYFNAPSREMIYKIVMMRSEGNEWLDSYNYEDFVAADEAARKEFEKSRSILLPASDEELRDTHDRHLPPVVIKGSWRDEARKATIRIPLR